MNNSNTQYDQICSLGYRCSSAGILKSLGLKTESYPFDWLVSRLPIIEHCLQTGFKHFLEVDNYECVKSVTNNYMSIDISEPSLNNGFAMNRFVLMHIMNQRTTNQISINI